MEILKQFSLHKNSGISWRHGMSTVAHYRFVKEPLNHISFIGTTIIWLQRFRSLFQYFSMSSSWVYSNTSQGSSTIGLMATYYFSVSFIWVFVFSIQFSRVLTSLWAKHWFYVTHAVSLWIGGLDPCILFNKISPPPRLNMQRIKSTTTAGRKE